MDSTLTEPSPIEQEVRRLRDEQTAGRHGQALAGVQLLLRAGDLDAARKIADAMATDGLRCIGGFSGRAASPGFFTGTAGIGYGLLRLEFPEELPCIAAMEAPLFQ